MEMEDEFRRIHNDMVSAFHSESDRGAALCSTAFLEAYMRGIIAGMLVEDAAIGRMIERLPFAGLVTLAHGLGLTSQVIHDDLLVLKAIRNLFAHHPLSLTFEEPELAAATGELSTAKYYRIGSETGELRTHEAPRERFLMAATQVIQQLARVRQTLERHQVPPNVTAYRWNSRGEPA